MNNIVLNGNNFQTVAGTITGTAANADFQTLITVLGTDANLTANAKKLYHQQVMSDGLYKGLDMGEINLYFTYLIQHPATLTNLIQGNVIFDNGYYKPVNRTMLDTAYLQVLDHALKKAYLLEWTNGHRPTNDQFTQLQNMISELDDCLDRYKQNAALAYLLDPANIVNTLPDVFAAYLVTNKQSLISGVVVPTVQSSSSPYISLDAGGGYNPGFSTAYTNYGVNIYFVPVDKTVPSKTFKSNCFIRALKTTSLTIGIINNYFSPQNQSTKYTGLLSGNKDLFLGLGHRINSLIKINVGFDCYEEKVSDPLSANKYFNAKFCFGLAIDLDVVHVMGNLPAAFGF
jgi:hypothetical protein